jgi:aminoglycoside phosphotransferase family enzyme
MRLNKRLAKDIYLGIVPLTVDEKGRPALEGSGVIIDWLVKMRRIREEQMLDYAIKHGEVNETEVRQAAVLLSDFYKGAPAMLTNPSQYRVRVRNEVQAVFLELLDPAFALPIPLVERLAGALLQYIAKQADLFDKRVQQGRIIEAHGDLRPEHICLGPIPAIIDCLEFSRELRILDTAEEVAYLAIECEFAGSKKIGELFFQVLSAVTKDAIPVSLICFYKLKRALLRALLVIRHVTEPEYKNDSQWLQKAHAYLQLAEQYLEKVGML